MAKTQKELNALKKDLENLNNKLSELSDEELETVVGGVKCNLNVAILPLLKTFLAADAGSPIATARPEEIMSTEVLKEQANACIYTQSEKQ